MCPDRRTGPRWQHALFGLLAAVVPALIGYVLLSQWRTPMLGLYRDASEPPVIDSLMARGPAEAGGLLPGDVLLSVNGASFEEGYDGQREKIYRFEIERDGQTLTLDLQASSMLWIMRYEVVSALVVALAFWGTGTVLLWRRFDQHDVRLLFLAFQCTAMALLPVLAYPRFKLPARWMVILEYLGLYLGAPLYLHYHVTFPVRLGTPRRRQWILGTAYALTVVAAIDGLVRPEPWHSPGAYYIVVVGLLALGVTTYVYFRRASPDGRRRLRVVVAGTLLGLFLPLLGFLLPTIVMGYSPDVPRWLVSLCLAIVPFSYLYATARHRLFGIDHLLNRTLVYAVLSAGLFTLYVGPVALLCHYLPGAWLPQAGIVSAVTLLVGLTFDWLRRQVQRRMDVLFYGGWYDYPGVVGTITDALGRSLDREHLTEVLVRQVPALMRLHGADLQISDQDVAVPEQQESTYPLIFQGKVRGVWHVGARRDGEPFSDTDRRILQTLSRQAQIALDNVLLVERLRRRVDEIREVQRQLLRSREAERARLARDLHDGPIQDLVGLNLQLGLLQAQTGSQEPPKSSLLTMRGEVQDLLSELRQVCVQLRPPMLDMLGLGAALRALVEEWSAEQDIPVDLVLPADDTIQSLPGDMAVNLYRIVQEALANVARHAEAQQAGIQLAWNDGQLSLTVEDNGSGFVVPEDLGDLAAAGHYGLVGLGERVELVGGTWTLTSNPGQGTTIRVDIAL